MIDPPGSWVAKWQRIVNHKPGMYAIEVQGQLPNDVLEHCDEFQLEIKAVAPEK